MGKPTDHPFIFPLRHSLSYTFYYYTFHKHFPPFLPLTTSSLSTSCLLLLPAPSFLSRSAALSHVKTHIMPRSSVLRACESVFSRKGMMSSPKKLSRLPDSRHSPVGSLHEKKKKKKKKKPSSDGSVFKIEKHQFSPSFPTRSFLFLLLL